jgi:hypothetical protein
MRTVRGTSDETIVATYPITPAKACVKSTVKPIVIRNAKRVRNER